MNENLLSLHRKARQLSQDSISVEDMEEVEQAVGEGVVPLLN